MAKFDGFSAAQMVVVNRVYRAARLALERAVEDLGREKYRRLFAEIMGSVDVTGIRMQGTGKKQLDPLKRIKSAEETLNLTIKQMHGRVGTQSFDVTFGDSTALDGANADMLSYSAPAPKDNDGLIDAYRSDSNNRPRMPMRLGSPFFAMPFKHLSEQSQIQTFLHELSHHAAGTIDDDRFGPTGCYEWSGVVAMKGAGPNKAVRNAENVGFFCSRYAA